MRPNATGTARQGAGHLTKRPENRGRSARAGSIRPRVRNQPGLSWALVGLGLLIVLAFTVPVPERSESFELSQGAGKGAHLELAYPAWLRAGEVGELTLRVQSSSAAASPNATSTIAQAWVVAENVRPDGDQQVTFPSGGNAIFSWQVAAEGEASWEGELWLALGMASGGEVLANPQPVLDRPLQFKVISPLGLGAETWRWIGAVLLLAGAILVIKSWGRTIKKK
mgnify:CR=1 FL=1